MASLGSRGRQEQAERATSAAPTEPMELEMPVPDLTAISAVTSSLKATSDIAKAMLGIRDAQLVREKAVELTTEIMSAQASALSAQTAQFDLIDRVRELEDKVTQLENWDREKQRYQLEEPAPGIFVYRTKPGMENGEPTHRICADCYHRGRKSFLQQDTRYPGRYTVLVCSECGTDMLIVGHRPHYTEQTTRPGSRRR
jgi:hypothetical protein